MLILDFHPGVPVFHPTASTARPPQPSQQPNAARQAASEPAYSQPPQARPSQANSQQYGMQDRESTIQIIPEAQPESQVSLFSGRQRQQTGSMYDSQRPLQRGPNPDSVASEGR